MRPSESSAPDPVPESARSLPLDGLDGGLDLRSISRAALVTAEEAVNRGLDRVEPLAGATIVDVGCGTGVVLGPLLRRLDSAGRVLAIDFAAAMVDISRSRRPDPRVTWLCAEALDADVPAASIDVLLCFDTLPHFANLERALATFAYWLAPGGRSDRRSGRCGVDFGAGGGGGSAHPRRLSARAC